MRQRGLTLVEIMLALSLGTVVLLGVVHLLQHNLRLYHQQQMRIGNHDDQRFLIQTLRHAIHMSGYLPCSTIRQRPELDLMDFQVLSATTLKNTHAWAKGISANTQAFGVSYASPKTTLLNSSKSKAAKIIDDCVHVLYVNPKHLNEHFFNDGARQADLVQQWFYLRKSTDNLSQGLFMREGKRSEELAANIKELTITCSHDNQSFHICTKNKAWQWVKITLMFQHKTLSFTAKRYNA